MAANNGIFAIILAAGSSSRLGQPKQIVSLGNISLIRQASLLALASDCEKVSVVVGANKLQVIKEIDDLDIGIVHNNAWSEGIASSIRAGISGLIQTENKVTGVLIMLVDQYRIGSIHLDKMISKFKRHHQIIVSEYGLSCGVPALFPARYFHELLLLKGDSGAKGLIKKYNDKSIRILCPEGESDLDNAHDLKKSQKEIVS